MNRFTANKLVAAVRHGNIDWPTIIALNASHDEVSHALWYLLLPDEYCGSPERDQVFVLLALGAKIDYLPADGTPCPEKERTIFMMLGLPRHRHDVARYLHVLLSRKETSAWQLLGYCLTAAALYHGLPRETLDAIQVVLVPKIQDSTYPQEWLDAQYMQMRLVA